jgi:hypothetical protein
MTVQVVERVTCDHCGASCDFEKLRFGLNERTLARVETLTSWLNGLGWRVIEHSLCNQEHTCPSCVAKK